MAMPKEPQISFALSRGFTSQRLTFWGDITQGVVLTDSHFALGYYISPFQGFQLAAIADRWKLFADGLIRRTIESVHGAYARFENR